MKNHNRGSGFVRAVKKLFLSAFVVVTFALYALQNRASGGDAPPTPRGTTARVPGTPAASAPSSATQAPAAAAQAPAAPAEPPQAAAPEAQPTDTSGRPSVANSGTTSSGYKNGTYTGPEVDVNWGYVQVQTTIQSGKISNVQFLEYPNDRRTSVRINSFAVPILQQEAVQAQSANVDIITGATLTSEGFEMSLQAALNQAKS